MKFSRLGQRKASRAVASAGPNGMSVTHKDMRDDKLAQSESGTVTQRKTNALAGGNATEQSAPNHTGLPDALKSGVESLSGLGLDDVRAHYNSSKPAELQALAYTQGTDIHLAPGQQRHLPHEAWHVIQQKQGRVKATTSVANIPVNDSPALEHEADQMASKAFTHEPLEQLPSIQTVPTGQTQTVQLAKKKNPPKAIKYKSLSKANRTNKVNKFKGKQYNLGRGRKLHLRHIIPRSDLQAWVLCARKQGNAVSIPGQMRRIIYDFLIFLHEDDAADDWETAYQNYEAAGVNQSFLQYDAAAVNEVWRLIEWHKRNLFLGHGGINTAIQNRFDAGKGAVAYRGINYINDLYDIWFDANSLLGLMPSPIQDTRIFSTHLNRYVYVRTAEHNDSRGVKAALGWLGRSDYERST